MTWARDAYGRAPWAAPSIPTAVAPGQEEIPPSIPDATTRFSYLTQHGTGPWGMRSFAGAMPLVAYPGGGISIAPDPVSGVMRVWVWWPDADGLQLIRVGEDGSRIPVRGGYPVTVTGPTRRNFATNPSVETGLNGFVPADGNPTLSNLPL